MTLELTLFISGLCIIGMCFCSFVMGLGFGMRRLHDSRRFPPDPPHTGWRKK